VGMGLIDCKYYDMTHSVKCIIRIIKGINAWKNPYMILHLYWVMLAAQGLARD